MADISKIKIGSTTYNVKDTVARANKILYFQNRSFTPGENTEILRITDPEITTNTIVLDYLFQNTTNLGQRIDWASYNGYIVFTGTCYAATSVHITLGNKSN